MPEKFSLTEEAIADLEEALAYIAQDSPDAALSVADQLERCFRMLGDWPAAAHKREDLTPHSEIRFWNCGTYVIAFSPAPTGLLVLAVVHGKRNIADVLSPRLVQF